MKIEGSRKLEENVFIDFDEEFTWPDLNNNICKTNGKCYALKDIINSDRCQNMLKGFKERKLVEPLCKHCGFIDKLNKDGGKI